MRRHRRMVQPQDLSQQTSGATRSMSSSDLIAILAVDAIVLVALIAAIVWWIRRAGLPPPDWTQIRAVLTTRRSLVVTAVASTFVAAGALVVLLDSGASSKPPGLPASNVSRMRRNVPGCNEPRAEIMDAKRLNQRTAALSRVPLWVPRWGNIQHPISLHTSAMLPGGSASIDPRWLDFSNLPIVGGSYRFFEGVDSDQEHETAVTQVLNSFKDSLTSSGFEVSSPSVARLLAEDTRLGRQVALAAISEPVCSYAEFTVTWKAKPQ